MKPEVRRYVPNGADRDIAQAVSLLTEQNQPLVVRRSTDDLLALYARGRGMVLLVGEQPGAHAAVTHEYDRRGPFRRHIYEVGAVVTDTEHQGNGFAGQVVTALIEDQIAKLRAERDQLSWFEKLRQGRLRPDQYVALVAKNNERSKSVFRRLGSEIPGWQLPSAVFSAEVGEYVAYDITPRPVHKRRQRRSMDAIATFRQSRQV